MAEETPADRPAASPPGDIDIDIDLARAIRRAFPWLELTRALGMSFGLGKIVLATVGVLLLELAWAGLERSPIGVAGMPASSSVYRNGLDRGLLPYSAVAPMSPIGYALTTAEPLSVLLAPLGSLVSTHPSTPQGLLAAGQLLATILVWGLFGGAIARIALVQAGTGGNPGMKGGLRYAIRHWRPLLATPLLPVLVLFLFYLASVVFGLVFRIPAIGEILGGVFLFVPIVLGFVMFVMVAGLALGWPLMVASVAAQGEDSLDAVSRSFSYLNHRLGRYAFSLFCAAAIGIFGLLFVSSVTAGTLAMTRWGLASTTDPAGPLPLGFVPATFSGSSDLEIGRTLGALWVGLVRFLPRAWAYSYFWTSIALIYLLIRKNVDGAEWSQLKADGPTTA